MKFKLSTLIWLTTFAAIVAAAFGWVSSERQKNQIILQQARALTASATAAEAKARKEISVARQELNLVRSRAKVFESVKDVSLPHLMWLGQPSWTSSNTYPKFQTSWNWRIYVPEQHEPLELCWSFRNIPTDGFPSERNVNSQDLIVGQPQIDANGNETLRWLGCAVIHCAITPTENSYYCDVDFGIHGLNSAPFSTEYHKSTGVFGGKTEVDWLRQSLPGMENYVEQYEIDEKDCRALSFDKPHVLVRIRGKRQVEGQFEVVDGPSPGFMLWIREKQVK